MAPKRSAAIITSYEEECLHALRLHELEAYAAVVTALRAEGELNEEKKTVLSKLQQLFCISPERHKAEIRRAANDDRLSSIAKQIHGASFDVEWQKEGRRLFDVLIRPTPITSYTKIADEIAAMTMKENAELLIRQDSDPSLQKARHILPPVNPHFTVEDLDYLLPSNKNKLSDANKSVSFSTVYTSTDDLEQWSNEVNKVIADNNQILPCDEGMAEKNNADSYVYLPSGTVVRLEHKPVPVIDVASDKTSSDTAPIPKKRAKKSSQDLTEDTSFVIKEVYRPEEIQAHRQRQASPQKKSVEKPDKPYLKHPLVADGQTALLKADMLQLEEKHKPIMISSVAKSQGQLLSLTSAKFRSGEEYYHHGPDKPYMTIQHTPVPPEHLYAVGSTAGTSVQQKAKAYGRRHSGSWATKHNVTTGARNKRRIQRSPLSSTQRKVHLQGYSRLPHQTSSKSFRQPLSGFFPDQKSLSNDAVFPSSDVRPNVLSAQKVFHSSMQVTGTSNMKSRDHIAELQDLSHRSLSTSLAGSIETGLASVSSIVSRVSSPASFTECKGVTSADRQPLSVEACAKPTYPISQPSLLMEVPNVQHKFSLTNLSKSAPAGRTEDLVNLTPVTVHPMQESLHEFSETKAPHSQPVAIKSLKSLETDQVKINSIPSCGDATTPPSSVSLAASGLCELAAGPVITDLSSDKPPTIKSNTVHLSSANIIKVTPRSLPSSKGLPIVTQISGSRITKTLTCGSGAMKPNIIVVRRSPGGKNVKTTPAKILEISTGSKGRGEKQIPVSQVKSLESMNASVNTSGCVIKPVTTKLVSIPTSVRSVPGKDGCQQTSFRKVISKGKMQQLILKPQASSLVSQLPKQLIDPVKEPNVVITASSLEGNVTKEASSIKPMNFSAENIVTSPTLMRASTTMRAIMAYQKKSLKLTNTKPKTLNQVVSGHKTNSPTVYSNTKHLMQKQRQQVTMLSANKPYTSNIHFKKASNPSKVVNLEEPEKDLS